MATPDQFAVWLESMPDRVTREVGLALGRAGVQLEGQIRANASGRPGPNWITGDYRGSFTVSPVGGRLAVVVGTNRPQARRLEFGFVGTDSLGRSYNQPPYPHVQPAVDKMRGPIEKDILKALAKATQARA